MNIQQQAPATVDGRDSVSVDLVNIPLFTGFHTCQVVVSDFFHQKYHYQYGHVAEH